MAEATWQDNLVEPDLEFVRALNRRAGESLKKCFHCATCSAICPIAPDHNPFPRKEMIWAQWGLKNRLIRDPDVWLCDQCNDCSQSCPRGAKPGDVMGAIRSEAVAAYAVPQFLGRALNDPRALPLLFTVPLVIFLAFMGARVMRVPPGPADFDRHFFESFFPHWAIYAVFVPLTVFIVATAVSALLRFWRDIGVAGQLDEPLGKSFVLAALDILGHSRFKDCEQARIRYIGHLLIFYGFLALFIATGLVVIGLYGFGWTLPLKLTHPVKILGNLGAAALVIGLAISIYLRLSRSEKGGRGAYFDWLFMVVLLAVGLTGAGAELARLGHAATIAYAIYFAHLVLVFFLLAYFPHSKFAHLMYRTAALVRAKQEDRYEQRKVSVL